MRKRNCFSLGIPVNNENTCVPFHHQIFHQILLYHLTASYSIVSKVHCAFSTNYKKKKKKMSRKKLKREYKKMVNTWYRYKTHIIESILNESPIHKSYIK